MFLKKIREQKFLPTLDLSIEKKSPTSTRKIPFLPRIGVYVDFAGYELYFKQVPFLESMLNLWEEGHEALLRQGKPLSVSRLRSIVKQQFSEIKFPLIKFTKSIDTTFRSL